MSKPSTSPFPLSISKPVNPEFARPLSECGLRDDVLPDLAHRSLYFLGDLALIARSDRSLCLPVLTRGEIEDTMELYGVALGDLPPHSSLVKELNYSAISPQLANAIKTRLALLMAGTVTDHENLGRPSYLALALLPDLPSDMMSSTLWDEFQDLLALENLRPKTKLGEIFQYQPLVEVKVAPMPLSEGQIWLLRKSIYDLETFQLRPLSQENFRWVRQLNYPYPGMIHVLCSLLAVRPEERPDELVQWFAEHRIPIEPLSFEDLKLIGEDARG